MNLNNRNLYFLPQNIGYSGGTFLYLNKYKYLLLYVK